MARESNRLNDLVIRQTKPDTEGGKSIILADGYGLRLVVMPSGRRYWQFKTKLRGKESTAQLGIYPAMTLEKARQEAERMRGIVREGRSPVAENRVRKLRNMAQAATTFEVVANELLAGKKKNCSPRYYKKISGALQANLFPMLGPLPIQSIDAPVLLVPLRRIETRGSLEMLENVRRWAGEVFDFAKAHGKYDGDNPAHVLLRNVFQKHKAERMEALEWDEVPDFMRALQTITSNPETVCAVKLLMLSACRPSEVVEARWAEVDEGNARWTIPVERMKTGKLTGTPHAVPLSKQTLDVLKELRPLTGHCDYLFPSRPGSKTKTLSTAALLKAVRAAAGRDIDSHGMRSTFSTYVSESLKWDDKVKEAALSHSKKGVEGAYDRATHYKERVKLMQWYADEIDAKASQTASVTSIDGKRSAA